MPPTCSAEHTVDHNLLEPHDRLVHRVREEHTLACCQTARFENDFEAAVPDIVACLLELGGLENFELRGRDVVTIHEILRKGFGPFHPRGKRGGSEDGNTDWADNEREDPRSYARIYLCGNKFLHHRQGAAPGQGGREKSNVREIYVIRGWRRMRLRTSFLTAKSTSAGKSEGER